MLIRISVNLLIIQNQAHKHSFNFMGKDSFRSTVDCYEITGPSQMFLKTFHVQMIIPPTFPLKKSHFRDVTCLHCYLVGAGLGVGHCTLIQKVPILMHGRSAGFFACNETLLTNIKIWECKKNGTLLPLYSEPMSNCMSPLLSSISLLIALCYQGQQASP